MKQKKRRMESILTSTILCTSTIRTSTSTSSSGNSTYINVLGAGDGGISTIGLDGIDECIDSYELYAMRPSLEKHLRPIGSPPPIKITGGNDNTGR